MNVSAWIRTASGPELGGELGGLREQPVAGEDRDQVVVAGVGRVGAAAQRGLVHHVVVVERADVGDLDDARGGQDLVGVGPVAGLGGQQHQQRPEPLAAGGEQVARRFGDVRRPAARVLEERRLDRRHPLAQTGGEGVVGDRQGQLGTGAPARSAHLMKSPALTTRSSTGPGTTPSTTVAARQIATVPMVSSEGSVTAAVSPASGSVKNITRMWRM